MYEQERVDTSSVYTARHRDVLHRATSRLEVLCPSSPAKPLRYGIVACWTLTLSSQSSPIAGPSGRWDTLVPAMWKSGVKRAVGLC